MGVSCLPPRLALTGLWKGTHHSQGVEGLGLCPHLQQSLGERGTGEGPTRQEVTRPISNCCSFLPSHLSSPFFSVRGKPRRKQLNDSISILIIWDGPHQTVKYWSHSLLKQIHTSTLSPDKLGKHPDPTDYFWLTLRKPQKLHQEKETFLLCTFWAKKKKKEEEAPFVAQ